MELPQDDLDDFKRGEHKNKIFWSRFAEQPDLKGSTVLDVGSGWGRLCVDMALAGAEKVVGLDLKTNLVGRIPFLEDYLTHNLYCILENSGVPLRSPDRSDGPPST